MMRPGTFDACLRQGSTGLLEPFRPTPCDDNARTRLAKTERALQTEAT